MTQLLWMLCLFAGPTLAAGTEVVPPPKAPADPFFAPANPTGATPPRVEVPRTSPTLQTLPTVVRPRSPLTEGTAKPGTKPAGKPVPVVATPLTEEDDSESKESSGTEPGSLPSSTTANHAPARIILGTGGVITRSVTPDGGRQDDTPTSAQNIRGRGGLAGAIASPSTGPNTTTTLPVLGSRESPTGPSRPRPTVITVEDGVNDLVVVSSLGPNRIATNFKPSIMDDGGVSADIKVLGNNVFLLPKVDSPFSLFIVDEAGGTAASLTLVPKRVPAQTIFVHTAKPRQDNLAGGPIDSHAAAVDAILRQATRGALGKEWLEMPIEVGTAQLGELRVTPERRWSTTGLVLDRFLITNDGPEVELREESFVAKGVKGVSFYPNVRLARGASTHVFILSGVAL